MVGMNADRRVHVRKALRQRQHSRIVLEIDAHAQRMSDALRTHVRRDLVDARQQFREVDVAVRVDEHRVRPYIVWVGRLTLACPASSASMRERACWPPSSSLNWTPTP